MAFSWVNEVLIHHQPWLKELLVKTFVYKKNKSLKWLIKLINGCLMSLTTFDHHLTN